MQTVILTSDEVKAKHFFAVPTALLLFLATGGLGIRMFKFIDRYAVNILYWDQWDFWKPILGSASAWEIFVWQHGPHRQGLGGWIIKLTALASHADLKVEAYVIGGLFIRLLSKIYG